jgi:hypothetical protein
VYNRENGEVLSSGYDALKTNRDSENSIHKDNEIYLDSFQSELYRIYLESKGDRSSKNTLILQVVGKFLKLLFDEAKTDVMTAFEQPMAKTFPSALLDSFHFIIIVPDEWEYDIRDKVIRTLFIAADLIEESDHPKRLLFFTEMESFLQQFQSFDYRHFIFTDGRQFDINRDLKIGFSYVRYTINYDAEERKWLIKGDALELRRNSPIVNSTDFSPRIIKSNNLKIDFDAEIRIALLNFLKKKGFFEEKDFLKKEEDVLNLGAKVKLSLPNNDLNETGFDEKDFSLKKRVLEEIITVINFYYFENLVYEVKGNTVIFQKCSSSLIKSS